MDGDTSLSSKLPIDSGAVCSFHLPTRRRAASKPPAPELLPERLESSHRLVHELFEEQVRRTPNAVAAVYEQQSLTYAQLNRRANRLALQLRAAGVGPDELVAVCVERSLEMLVGVIAVLKAGGAYVPLDPDYPAARLQQMLADAAPRALLIQENLRPKFACTAVHVIALLSNEPGTFADDVDDLDAKPLDLRSDHLAYVIYTSGSTGRPKGVMVEHRNVLGLWQALKHVYSQAQPCRRVAVNASFTFDASVKQLVQVLSGRTLVLVPKDVRWDAERLLDFLQCQRIDSIDCTPWQLKSWVAAGLLENTRYRPRMVLVGGEALDAELWTRLANCAETAFYNVYGPTECTVDATIGRISGDTSSPHIGRPIANGRIYILDESGEKVPVGTAGEIHIAGAGVARGYRSQPGLTAERFLPDPFFNHPSARMYKSGDLARSRSDGTIEYLGRNDHQVKVRGFRIELGEIEAQLARREGVRDAVVVAREDAPGDKRLVAYVVPRSANAAPSVKALREHLKLALPDYMMPSAIVTLERLPLTQNLKLDRRALPRPSQESLVARHVEPPRGRMEELLAHIWAQLLDIEHVGREDGFFELGGHSLLIVQMLEQLRRVGLTVDVQRIFESSSLAELACALRYDTVRNDSAPATQVPADCELITPAMLPLVQLQPNEIKQIVASVPGGARNIKDIYPLAPLQEGILFHHRVNERRGDTYILPTLLSLSSRAKLDALIDALQELIDRHDVLRTAVLWERLTQPVQVVYRYARLHVEELALDAAIDPIKQLTERMKPERLTLDLRRAPLLRLQVACDPDGGTWYAILRLHHIISDHESREVLIEEMMTCFEGRGQTLPAPVAYRNHVAQALASARIHDAESFFRSKLADVDEPTAPFGLLDVYGVGSQLQEATEVLEPTLASSVRAHARGLNVSPAALFHAAWALVVAHTAARDDVVFGTLLLGRLHGSAGVERTLGMFINTLPLRLRLRDITAGQLVEYTHRELVELLNYEQASLAVAQRCSGIVGSAPLLTSLLNYLHSPPKSRAGQFTASSGLRVLAVREWTNYPIVLSVDDQGERFVLNAQTDHRIDAHRIIAYTSAVMRSLVQALEEAPHSLAMTLSMLPNSEHLQVTASFNTTEHACARDKLIHQQFEEQATRTPNAVAVECEGRSLTYAELNERANQLARYLISRGVEPDQRVGLCTERSLEMVLGVLGIWKAGAAYVPLDPQYPGERLAYMLRDAAPKVVLTQRLLRERLPSTSVEVTALDEWDEIGKYNASDLDEDAPELRAHHLAYVIYTSGSTGQPKGVMIEHRNVMNLWQGLEPLYATAGCQRVALNASFNFDASVQQFVQLLSGRTLHVIDQQTRRDAEWLLRFVEQRRVEAIDCTPSQLKTWVSAGLLDREGHLLRLVLVGGEAIDEGLWDDLARCERIAFYNVYGPTECTVDATAVHLRGDRTAPHLGRPMQNRRIYILNGHRQPVPIGVPGELSIGGAGIGRGYLNQARLTAERFIPDPFSHDSQARMYRTGDLGRWRADGTIEYLGRDDHQVKLRGFRIELGEIETQLTRHRDVKEAVVIAREDVPGEKQLVAYVVLEEPPSTTGTTVEALRGHLKALLPEHMVPGAFVILRSMPLTPNGKLDRRALPVPELGAYLSREYEAPRGEVEESLARIWMDLLRIERVGRNDNFFELGGHSLLAGRVVTRISHVLEVDVPLRVLFEQPTIAQLGGHVAQELDVELSMEGP